MKSVILCEGHDEVYVIGYYLYGTKNWELKKEAKFSKLYQLSKKNHNNQSMKIYLKGEDTLAIWAVGGKDSFKKPLKSVFENTLDHPDDGVNQLFILLDRDESEISECLTRIENEINLSGVKTPILENNKINTIEFSFEGESYQIKIIPVIIPFEENGALENVLLNSIASEDKESEYVVKKAKEYIEDFYRSDFRERYLNHARLKTKAEFSAAISITNPDRSTAEFNKLLTSHKWYESDVVRKHFEMIDKLL